MFKKLGTHYFYLINFSWEREKTKDNLFTKFYYKNKMRMIDLSNQKIKRRNNMKNMQMKISIPNNLYYTVHIRDEIQEKEQ